jgi:hypothetical protein
LKARGTAARISAARAVNRDLKETFPGTTGFSPRNLRDMKRFYLNYTDEAIWRQAVAKLAEWVKAGDGEVWRQAVANVEKGDARPPTEFL